jgi:hypothetical protein
MSIIFSFTIAQIVLLFLPVALTIAVPGLAVRFNARVLIRLLGYNNYVRTAAFAAVLHEASHAVMALLFFHKIAEFSIMSFDETTGRLGCVTHTYNKHSLYQSCGNLFIGIAPFMTGVLLFMVTGFLLDRPFIRFAYHMPAPTTLTNLSAILKGVILQTGATLSGLLSLSNLLDIQWYAYMVVAVVLGNMMAPSLADIKNVTMGAVTVGAFLLLVNTVFYVLGSSFTTYMLCLVRLIFGILHATAVIIFINFAFSLLLLSISFLKSARGSHKRK